MNVSNESNVNWELMAHRLAQLEAITEKSNESAGKLLQAMQEQSELIAVMIERHDRVSSSNERLWQEVGQVKQQVKTLELTSAEDRPVILAVRGISRQITTILVATIIGAILAPVAVTTYILNVSVEKAPTHEETKQQAPRDPKQ